MRALLHRILPALVVAFALLALPPQSRAQDDTNAALITDGGTWAQSMNQVMGGASIVLPRPGGTIRGPMGIYANTRLVTPLGEAQNLVCPNPAEFCEVPTAVQAALVDQYLTTYFGYLLDDEAVSGLFIQMEWQDLQPSDPGPDPLKPNPASFYFNYVDDAFNAIIAWNTAHPEKSPKTLQLDVTPGFNSPLDPTGKTPNWLLNYLKSCDGLFMSSTVVLPNPALTGCGYTTIFYRTENTPLIQLPLPMPWNPTYKAYWRAFLTALNQHINTTSYMKIEYASLFVSIGVGGPTASSTEMILPNGDTGANNLNASALTASASAPPWDVYTAWNCLLANAYGVPGTCQASSTSTLPLSSSFITSSSSSYINSDRAFIEEWTSAIDMYGEIFSGVTLIVTTGNGLPNFPFPNNSYLTNAPPAFAPDCGIHATTSMDCAAETAILAYFAGPPVGGANAKATAMAGLTVRDLTATTPASGSQRVKWLTDNTTDGPSVLNSSSSGTGSMALVSRMLGGLQFAQSFSDTTPSPTTGHSQSQFEGCTSPEPPPWVAWCTTTAEQSLLGVLTAYFDGTSVGGRFAGGRNTITVGSATVVDAPLNYLQIWDDDILYARGWWPPSPSCGWQQFMTAPATPGGPAPGCPAAYPSGPTVSALGSSMTAQQLLNSASKFILTNTAEPATNPSFCCPSPYVPRGAFQGDPVCVTPGQASEVIADNNAAAAGTSYSSGYNYTDSSYYTTGYYAGLTPVPSIPNGIVPYGICGLRRLGPRAEFLYYRQAYLGDYVCVSAEEANQVRKDNAQFLSRRNVSCLTPPHLPLPEPRLPPWEPPLLPEPFLPAIPLPPGPLLGAPGLP